MIYKWSIDKYNIDAEKAGKELERIEKKHNGMNAKKVVDESRDEKAILHKCFEWNNEKAAEGYREVQAKEIIRHLIVVEIVEDKNKQKEEVETRAFVSVKSDEMNRKKKYVSLGNAMSDEYYKQQLIMQAISELQSFKQKYKDLIMFKEIFEAIEKIAI
jgi:hypothetical protein